MKTNNYKLYIINKCPKCFSSKIDFDVNTHLSAFNFKKIKNFKWKKVFVKTEKSTGSGYLDHIFGPISKSICRNWDNPNKNPQDLKMRILSNFNKSNKQINKTFNQLHCNNCGYYEFTENATYLDILKEK